MLIDLIWTPPPALLVAVTAAYAAALLWLIAWDVERGAGASSAAHPGLRLLRAPPLASRLRPWLAQPAARRDCSRR